MSINITKLSKAPATSVHAQIAVPWDQLRTATYYYHCLSVQTEDHYAQLAWMSMDERNLAVLNVKYMSMERSRRHDLRTAVCKLQQCERGQRHCPSVVSLSLHAVTCPECQRKDYVWEHCEPVQCITLSQCITHCRSVSHIVAVYHIVAVICWLRWISVINWQWHEVRLVADKWESNIWHWHSKGYTTTGEGRSKIWISRFTC